MTKYFLPVIILDKDSMISVANVVSIHSIVYLKFAQLLESD